MTASPITCAVHPAGRARQKTSRVCGGTGRRLLAVGMLAVLATGCTSGSADAPPTGSADSSASSAAAGGADREPSEPSEPAETTSEPAAGQTAPDREQRTGRAGDRPDRASITIADFVYSDVGEVGPGSTVTLRNRDEVAHTVTARAGDDVFDVSVPPGGRATLTAPERPGTYKYYCTFHATMTGTLVVG